jgi:peptidyl-dipeptidase A
MPQPTIADAQAFLDRAESQLLIINNEGNQADWVAETYITQDTEAINARANDRGIALTTALIAESHRFDALPLPPEMARKIRLLRLSLSLPAPADAKLRAELTGIVASMSADYGRGKFCPAGVSPSDPAPDDPAAPHCMGQDEAEVFFATHRDPKALAEAWVKWHDIGAPMRDRYARFVELSNQGARELGYADTGVMWRSNYDMPADDFSADIDRLWAQLQPLYVELHTYVRHRLIEKYGAAAVRPDGMIPADLLGNIWAQEWGNVDELVAPAAATPSYNLTKILQQRLTATPDANSRRMVKYGESFFESLGYQQLPETFWQRSQFIRPRDRDVICHASAWDVNNDRDVRLKVCLRPNADDFVTTHHELGHIYYQLAYRNQPYLFRNGANDGFHEAIGDAIALSITPDYLKTIGLLQQAPPPEADIPLLLHTALDKIAFLPFALVMDKWRWEVFSGKVTPAQYERAWWDLREKYQGVAPPVDRSEADFDPAAKNHIATNVPYIRYFLARVYQFQFYRAMCEASGYKGPLNRCSFYGSKAAGDKLNAMLSLGASKPWPDALEAMTGSRKTDATALVEYFQPLLVWLKQQNRDEKPGWQPEADSLKAAVAHGPVACDPKPEATAGSASTSLPPVLR